MKYGRGMGSGSPFADSPVTAALVPEVCDTPAGEPRADCARCPMAREPAPPPWSFTSATYCCTYHPFLVSFRAGAALARGGDGAAQVMARLADPVGVSALGIAPPPERAARQLAGRDFGQEAAPRCPFWVGGEHACSVWHDRPPVCRGWYCKHDDGLGGAVDWTATAALVRDVEDMIARRLAARGTPPAAGAGAAAWAEWFRWCAWRVTALDGVDLAALRAQVDGELAGARDQLVRIRRRPRRALGERLVPSVSEMFHGGERVWLTGYSTYDAATAPPSVFDFLARLDGDTPWRDALAASGEMTEVTVAELHRVGAIRAADGSDDLPFSVEPLTHAAETRP